MSCLFKSLAVFRRVFVERLKNTFFVKHLSILFCFERDIFRYFRKNFIFTKMIHSTMIQKSLSALLYTQRNETILFDF